MKIYKFANCYLNARERKVIKDGEPVVISSKALDVLELLVERSGVVVSKDEILGTVWNGSFVEEGNLPVHISKLRRQLGETKSARIIETVQGIGYRFVLHVENVSPEVWRKQLIGRGRRSSDKPGSQLSFDSVAVLPFRNETNSPKFEYLADGLTESIINNLCRIPGLRVTARDTIFRYKSVVSTVQEIGHSLGVSAALSGRIVVIDEHVFISVELLKIDDGTQIWGTQFNRPFAAIVEILNEISARVTEMVEVQICTACRGSANRFQTNNAESYRLFLKGKFLMEKRNAASIVRAIEKFEASVSADSTHVLSYVEIVECHILLYAIDHATRSSAVSKIEPLLAIVHSLDQDYDAVHAMYGGVELYLNWGFRSAEKHLQRALRLNPHNVFALYRYSNLLIFSGRFSEALTKLNEITEIDPLSVSTCKRIGRLYYAMRRFEDALYYLDEALELVPNDYEALILAGAALAELGQYERAIANLNESLRIERTAEAISMMGYVRSRKGEHHEVRRILDELKAEMTEIQKHEVKFARIYAASESKAKAFECLESAFRQHDVDLISINFDPRWRSIQADPRFKALAGKVGQETSTSNANADIENKK